MYKIKICLLGIGLCLSSVASAKKDQYKKIDVPHEKKEKVSIKIQKEELDGPKKFGQFESPEAQDISERELASNQDEVKSKSTEGESVQQKPVFLPERMRWKDRRN